jgi:hypothetical protein
MEYFCVNSSKHGNRTKPSLYIWEIWMQSASVRVEIIHKNASQDFICLINFSF